MTDTPTARPRRSTFTLNGAPVPVRADHPHLLAALREELDVTSPKDGCSPSGQCGCCTVLVDGKAVVVVPAAAGQGRRAGRSRRSKGFDDDERAALRRRVRGLRRRCSAASASPASSCGPRPWSTRRAPTSTRERHGPPPRRPPLPLHRLRQDPRRHRGWSPPARSRCRRCRAASAPAARGTRRASSRSATALHRRPPRARDAARRAPPRPTTPAPTSCRIDIDRGADGARRGRRAHRRRRARRAAGRHHPHGLAGLHPRGRAHVLPGDVLAIVVAETAAAGPRGGRAGRRRLRRAPADHRPGRRRRRPRARGVGHRRQRALACPSTARGDVDAALRRQRARRARGVPDPAHRARLPRARVDARRARPPTARCTCTRAARACGTTATRSRRCSASSATRITVELVSNGGAFGGKEDMANQAQTALAAWLLQRPVKCTLSPRGVPAASTPSATRSAMEYRAGCDADGRLTALQARMIGDSGAVRLGRA